MGGRWRTAPIRAAVRLAALLLLLAPLLTPSWTPPSPALAAGCNGDEQILLAPIQPRVGSPMIVAAVSRFAHEQVMMLGPAGPLPVTREPLGERFIWPATVAPDHAGDYLFAFGVVAGAGPLTICANTIVSVAAVEIVPPPADGAAPADPNGTPGTTALAPSVLLPSLHPWLNGAQATPGATPEAGAGAPDGGTDPSGTPRPTRTPARRPASENGNANDNDNDNTTDPTPTRTPTNTREPTSTRTPTSTRESTPTSAPTDTRTPTPTRTPHPDPTDTSTPTPRPDPTDTPVPTATLAPAVIDGVSGAAVCGQAFTIRGQRFGANRDQVDGKVTIDGRSAEVLTWEMSRIEVRVPLTARAGNDRQIQVTVSGRTASLNGVRVSC